MAKKAKDTTPPTVDLIKGKSAKAIELYDHFIAEYQKIGNISIHPAKTMIGIATERRRIAYVTQLGKDFIHVVFMFPEPHHDNLCFVKVAQVPGQKQFNHHCRILAKSDVNAEVKKFMKMAYQEGL